MASTRYGYDDDGNLLIEGISVSVKPNSYKVSQSFKDAVKDIEIQFKTSAISETEYYRHMEELRNTYLEKGTKEWWTYTQKIIDYEEKIAKEAQKAAEKAENERLKNLEKEKKEIEALYNDIYKTICREQEEIAKEQARFAEKISDYTEPFYTTKNVYIGQGEFGKDLVFTHDHLSDLDETLDTLHEYHDLLTAVKERGEEAFGEENFRDFFVMLRDLSIDDGAALSKLLLKENDEGFKDFIGDFNEINSYALGFSKETFEYDTRAAIDKSIKYMEDSLKQSGLEIPEGFFISGSISAEKFGEGFVSQISSVMQEISDSFDALLPDINVESAEDSAISKIFSPVYNIFGGGETIIEKLKAAASHALIDKLRGGY